MASAPAHEIRSSQNPSFKKWRRWVLDPSNPECPSIPLSGDKQVRELLPCPGARLLVVSHSRWDEWRDTAAGFREAAILPDHLLSQLSPVRTAPGVLAFFDKPSWGWDDLTPCVVFADGLQDPGNLGTILRTAAGTGIFSLVTGPETVSCFNDKVVRATAGYLFSVPFLEHRKVEALTVRGYSWVVADPDGGTDLFSFRPRAPLALLVGREGGTRRKGPAEAIRVRIPMAAGIDSLNAGVAASLIMYEVLRRQVEAET